MAKYLYCKPELDSFFPGMELCLPPCPLFKASRKCTIKPMVLLLFLECLNVSPEDTCWGNWAHFDRDLFT